MGWFAWSDWESVASLFGLPTNFELIKFIILFEKGNNFFRCSKFR